MRRIKVILQILASWGLLILALSNLASYARLTQKAWDGFMVVNKGMDDVSRWESRVSNLKTHLPEGSIHIGYVSSKSENIEYYLTQYAIIPHVLKRTSKPEWLIVNLDNSDIQEEMQKLGIVDYTFESYGYGLYLIHKK